MELDRIIEEIVSPKGMLAGNLNAMFKTCGRAGCDCMKKNGKRHPFNQFSFKDIDKTKTFSVNRKDFDSVQKKISNYNNFRAASLELGRFMVVLSREHGYDAAQELMLKAFDKARRKSFGLKPESTLLNELTVSRDKWKNKAKQRHSQLAKNVVTIRDLKISRDKWKNKSKANSDEIYKLEMELFATKKELSKMKDNNKKKLLIKP